MIELGFVGQRVQHAAFVKKALPWGAVGHYWVCFVFLSVKMTVRWRAGPLET